MSWCGLPSSVEVNGRQYAVATDYRDILEIIGCLTGEDLSQYERLYIALGLFYDDFSSIPPSDYQEAYDQMSLFISCGEEDTGRPSVKLIDWEQDERMIASEINKVAGYEVRSVPYLHWWTFIGYFNGIGEGQLSTVVSIRNKLKRGKKLEKWERDYYSENRRTVDLRQKYTAEEKAEMERLKELLGG